MRLVDCDRDREIANRIIHHPEVYPTMCDDHTQPGHTQLGSFLLMQGGVWLVHPSEHVLFMATPRTLTMFECHTMIEPAGRGRQAVADGIAAAKYLFENSTCQKIITYVPFFNKPAKVFARLAGFKEEGICTKSFLKDGTLYDQWNFGLEKEMICL
jgi:hypothetical protein